jgi:hypothetical protein
VPNPYGFAATAVTKAAEKASHAANVYIPEGDRISRAAASARDAMLAGAIGDNEAKLGHHANAKADHDYLASAYEAAGRPELAMLHRYAGGFHGKAVAELQARPEIAIPTPSGGTRIGPNPYAQRLQEPGARQPKTVKGAERAAWQAFAERAGHLSETASLATLKSGRGYDPTKAVKHAVQAQGAKNAAQARAYHLLARAQHEKLAAHHSSLVGPGHEEAVRAHLKAAYAHGAAAELGAVPATNTRGLTWRIAW